MAFTLAVDGDSLEQACSSQFLSSDLPAYEKFWLKHVVPLTNRPGDRQLKDDAALAAIGKGLDLIRFGGHLSKGGYDVQTNGRHASAPAAPALR